MTFAVSFIIPVCNDAARCAEPVASIQVRHFADLEQPHTYHLSHAILSLQEWSAASFGHCNNGDRPADGRH